MLLGIAAVIAILASLNKDGPQKVMDVSVRVNSFMITVTSKGTSDVVGQDMDVYINGSPPSGYKATAKAPAIGESRSILLEEFVDGDKRFDSEGNMVTEVWVGAGDYHFAGFEFKR
jgi:hypothetical protein